MRTVPVTAAPKPKNFRVDIFFKKVEFAGRVQSGKTPTAGSGLVNLEAVPDRCIGVTGSPKTLCVLLRRGSDIEKNY